MKIERSSLALVERILDRRVTSNESCEAAGAELLKVKAMQLAWEEHTAPNIARWYDGWKKANEEKRRVAEPLRCAELWLKEQVGAWKLKLDARERQAQLAAEDKAQRAAVKDRAKEISALKKAGDLAEARTLANRPVVLAPIVARVERPVLSKIAVGERWDYEIVDEAALPDAYTMRVPDLVKIRQTVKAMKGEARIAGVRVFVCAAVAAGAEELA